MALIPSLQDALTHLPPGFTATITVHVQEGSPLLHLSEWCAKRSGDDPVKVSPSELQLRASGEYETCIRCEHAVAPGAIVLDGVVLGNDDVSILTTAAGLLDQLERVEHDVLPLAPANLAGLGEHLAELRIEIEKLGDSSHERVTELVGITRSRAAALLGEIRSQLRAHDSELRTQARRILLELRGWDDACELESDEVLIGVEHFDDTTGDAYFLESVLAAFSLRGQLEEGGHTYVLRAPRFFAELIRDTSDARVQTAPLPDTPETQRLAAALWEPGASTPLASIASCVSTARDLLALAA